MKSMRYTLVLSCIFIMLGFAFLWLSTRRASMETFYSAKDAIVVLTKGYGSLDGYDQLIRRNTSINNMFYSQLENKDTVDVLIFHEGNVPIEHQQYIQNATPLMPLVFKHVAFQQGNHIAVGNFCHTTELSERFTMGYKNMCRFWSIGMFQHMKGYVYIIRIDEDCVLHKMDPRVLDKYRANQVMFASPKWIGEDAADVTIGMYDFFRGYKLDLKRDVPNPYTNFMVINLPYFASRIDVQTCLAAIDGTNCIFVNRWGDMPLWGYILAIFIKDQSLLLEDKEIAYYHGSHGASVNI